MSRTPDRTLPAPDEVDPAALFRRGFVAMLPLWAGAIPAGIAYGVAARAAGLSAFETQLMSALVFSAAAQLGAVSLLAAGTAAAVVVATAMALTVQVLLIGLAVGRQLRLSWFQRLLTAWLLTDAAYAVAGARERLRLPVLLGAGASMFAAWNGGTALGVVAGGAVPDPQRLGIAFVVPLSFLAVLAPRLRSRTMVLVALAAGVTTLLLVRVAPGGVAVLGAGIVGSMAGAWVARQDHASTGADGADEREGASWPRSG
jgi:predicted branched-subunit amino acid permease